MAGNVRQRMIAGALDLLSRRGLQSTSFAEVTQATHTPRGSIYHHFPGGKQELVLEALDANARDFVTHVEQVPRQTPEEFAATLVTHLRHYIVESNYSAGCAAAAVTVAAENEEQLERCHQVFSTFLEATRSGLVECGVTDDAARDFAVLTVTSMGGANTLARAARNTDVLDSIERQLRDHAASLPRT